MRKILSLGAGVLSILAVAGCAPPCCTGTVQVERDADGIWFSMHNHRGALPDTLEVFDCGGRSVWLTEVGAVTSWPVRYGDPDLGVPADELEQDVPYELSATLSLSDERF